MDRDDSERAQARQARFAHFMRVASVRPDNPATAHITKRWAKDHNTKEDRKIRQRLAARAMGIAAAYTYNGPDLPVDRYLRNFQLEYNGRTFSTYGDQQPSSFRVLSDYVEPDEKSMVLRLADEEFSIFDLTEFLDFYTGKDHTPTDLRTLREFTSYEFNHAGLPAAIELPDLGAFRFGGQSILRNGSAVSAMAVFGEPQRAPHAEEPKFKPNPEKPFLKDVEVDHSPEGFFGIEGYAPVILLMTVDAESRSYTSRFVLRETKSSFNVVYDDPYTDHHSQGRMSKSDFEKFSTQNRERMAGYDGLFRLMVTLFDLPAYFAAFEDDVRTEVITHALLA